MDGSGATHVFAGTGIVVQGFDDVGPARGIVAVNQNARATAGNGADRPPTSVATTGAPQACASRATSPNDSLKDGITTTSAERNQPASFGALTGARWVTTSSSPAAVMKDCRLKSLAPLKAPRMVSSRSMSGRLLRRIPAASTKTCGPLKSLDASGEEQVETAGPHAKLGAGDGARNAGVNTVRSTPGGAMSMWSKSAL